MIANCKQARHGEEIGDYNKEKKVNGVHVATEIFRNNVFGIDAKECVKEMREAQEQSGHKLKNGFFRIEITPSKEEQATEWTEEQWQSVITDYCQRMGISNSQAIWFHHSRTDNDEQSGSLIVVLQKPLIRLRDLKNLPMRPTDIVIDV